MAILQLIKIHRLLLKMDLTKENPAQEQENLKILTLRGTLVEMALMCEDITKAEVAENEKNCSINLHLAFKWVSP